MSLTSCVASITFENYRLHHVHVEQKRLHRGSVSNLWLVRVCSPDKVQKDLCTVKSHNKPRTYTHRHRLNRMRVPKHDEKRDTDNDRWPSSGLSERDRLGSLHVWRRSSCHGNVKPVPQLATLLPHWFLCEKRRFSRKKNVCEVSSAIFFFFYAKKHKSCFLYVRFCFLLPYTLQANLLQLILTHHMQGSKYFYGKPYDLRSACLPYSVWTATILPLFPHALIPLIHPKCAIRFFSLVILRFHCLREAVTGWHQIYVCFTLVARALFIQTEIRTLGKTARAEHVLSFLCFFF